MTIEDRNCEILFEYLRSILYDAKPGTLDINELDEPFRKLGMGLQCLDESVREMKAYSADLSIGNLFGVYPGRENFLCENLKTLHANLNHLTWQAKQVAAGDYSQHVSYLGEFSEAFNTMTQQLSEREKLLKQETEELTDKSYTDLLTHIGNRFWFTDQMEKLLKRKDSFVLCFIDLDHFKYVNDKYGHLEGDEYLKRFVHVVRRKIREEDLFARIGGDEFCTVFRNCSVKTAEDKLMMILQEFSKDEDVKYPASFSYGIVEVRGKEETLTVTEILKRADAQMYEQKRIHKQMYKEKLV